MLFRVSFADSHASLSQPPPTTAASPCKIAIVTRTSRSQLSAHRLGPDLDAYDHGQFP
jgi:hypothetical protein